MAKLFPFRPDRDHDTAGPRLVNLQDDGASDVFSALSADTARTILSRIYESPATASDVAEAADTSLQNARYHLEKLESAGLIEDVDTWYSSRGTEMTVYGPTNDPLVVAAGDDESESVIERALERIVGAVALLAVASVFIDQLIRRVGITSYTAADPGGPDLDPNAAALGTQTDTPVPAATGDQPTATQEAASTTSQTVDGTSQEFNVTTEASEIDRTMADTVSATPTGSPTTTPDPQLVADGGVDLVGQIPPGAIFFAGGLAVVAAVSAWWYLHHYRPMYG